MLLGLTGRAGSGKDTVADILVRDHGFIKVALADILKRVCRDVFAFTDEQLWGSSSARNAPDMRYPCEHSFFVGFVPQTCRICGCPAADRVVKKCCLTPRHALQQLGTDWGRRCYANVWVDRVLRVAAEILRGARRHEDGGTYAPIYNQQEGLTFRCGDSGAFPTAPGVVISDVRFLNEVAAIRAKGGRIWKTAHGTGLAGAAGAHESEQHIDSIVPDATVPDSPLDALPVIVTTMLKEARDDA